MSSADDGKYLGNRFLGTDRYHDRRKKPHRGISCKCPDPYTRGGKRRNTGCFIARGRTATESCGSGKTHRTPAKKRGPRRYLYHMEKEQNLGNWKYNISTPTLNRLRLCLRMTDNGAVFQVTPYQYPEFRHLRIDQWSDDSGKWLRSRISRVL